MQSVIYARLVPANLELGIEKQLASCREYAKKNGWKIAREFLETENYESVVLKEMLTFVKEKKIKNIVVYDSNIFSLNKYTLNTYKNILKLCGAKIETVRAVNELACIASLNNSLLDLINEEFLCGINNVYFMKLKEAPKEVVEEETIELKPTETVKIIKLSKRKFHRL